MVFAVTILLSAFLLFQVQPILGKYILPWFGGGASVWTGCLLFFQVMLFAGYAYAHLLGKISKRRAAWLHLTLLILSLASLPIKPNPDIWKVGHVDFPQGFIFLLLLANVGAPYFLLSSTGSLFQRWFYLLNKRIPYRLYAVSNIGSLLGLLAFPFLVEPLMGRNTQVMGWSGFYVLFVVCAGWTAWQMARAPDNGQDANSNSGASTIPWHHVLLWLCLAAAGSALLLATTNQLTHDVSPIPFLWVLPLSIYLLSFIICFDNEKWYHRGVFGPLLILSVAGSTWALHKGVKVNLWQQIAIHGLTLFAS